MYIYIFIYIYLYMYLVIYIYISVLRCICGNPIAFLLSCGPLSDIVAAKRSLERLRNACMG